LDPDEASFSVVKPCQISTVSKLDLFSVGKSCRISTVVVGHIFRLLFFISFFAKCRSIIMPPPPAKKRRGTTLPPTTPTNRPSSSSAKRQPSASSVTAAAAAKIVADSVQVNISFAQRDPYPIGMKILLLETIYQNASAVRRLSSFCVWSVLF